MYKIIHVFQEEPANKKKNTRIYSTNSITNYYSFSRVGQDKQNQIKICESNLIEFQVRQRRATRAKIKTLDSKLQPQISAKNFLFYEGIFLSYETD